MNAIDKRMFYLMLSAPEGQYYAQEMGFPPPSEEVQEIEKTDVMTRWGIFVATEIYQEIVEGSDWFIRFLKHFDKLGSNSDELREILTVFGIAITNKLIDSDKVVIMLEDFFSNDDEDSEDYE